MSAAVDTGATPPGLARRLAALLYEGVLLFGVVFFTGMLYSVLTRQQHAMQGRTGMGLVIFLSVGLYFVGFWTKSGQTLPMKTWHLRVVRADGRPLGWGRAVLRYLLSWLWFVPSLLAVWLAGLHDGRSIAAITLAGWLVYAGLSRLHPDRQFLHDALCRTRLVDATLPARAPA